MRASAPAKVNLALVVGPLRHDGKHELLTVYQRVGLADRIDLEPAERMRVDGFAGDTLVYGALELLAAHAATTQRWHAKIEKRIPVAAGLGGGSSDAATALRLANETLDEPLPHDELHDVAAEVGRRRSVLPRRRAAPRLRRRHDARSARPAAGLLDPARPPEARTEGRRPRPSMRRSTSGTAPTAGTRAATRSSTRSSGSSGRAISPRSRRTTSRRRRSPASSSRSARSAPTSAAPGLSSTASSITRRTRRPRSARCAGWDAPG